MKLTLERDGEVIGEVVFALDGPNVVFHIEASRFSPFSVSKIIKDHAFGRLGGHRLTTTVRADAPGLLSIVSRFMRLEGILREAWPSGDGYCDVAVFGLLAEEA